MPPRTFSSRFPPKLDSTPLHALTQAFMTEALHGGRELIDLTLSNPTKAGLEHSPELLRALADPAALKYNPDARGLCAAREAIASRTGRISADHLVLTASTSEAYSFLFKLLCDPDDQVLVPRPSYPLFEFLGRFESVDVVQYPLFYDHGWHIDMSELRARITPRTRAVLVVNPNNPTGHYLRPAEYAELARICSNSGAALISDEVFSAYQIGPRPDLLTSIAGSSDVLTFALDGLSKAAALPQLKLAWIAVSGPASLRDEALARLELIADTFLSVNTPVQLAVPKIFDAAAPMQALIRSRIRENLTTLRETASTTGLFRVLEVDGGWSAVLDVSRALPEEEWVERLLHEQSVLVQPGYFYDFSREGYLILSLLTPPEALSEGARRLSALARIYCS